MIRIGSILLTSLACVACSAPEPSASTVHGHVHPAATATAAPAAKAEEQEGGMGIEAHVLLKKYESTPNEKSTGKLKPSYPDKEAFLSDVKANHPPQAIALDDSTVWEGFGPAAQYHTNKDGSISR